MQLNRKVALNKKVRYDTTNPFVLYMTYWHKVQTSCRQTQPVLLRRGVWFIHYSLFRHQASGHVNSSAARALCGIGIALPHFLLASSIYRCLVRIWPVWRKPYQLSVCNHVNLKTSANGWHEWKLFQIGDVVFGFPTRSIAHHEIN